MRKRTHEATTRFVNIRCTTAEHRHVNRLAREAGLTVGDYMRGLVPGLAESNDAAAVSAVGKEPASAT